VISLNPYAYLEDVFPDVEVRAADLGEDWGLTVWDDDGTPTVYYAFDLGEIQRRCVLWHEIRHLHRGAPCRQRCPNDEADCREETARLLLPDIDELGRAMARWPAKIAAERLGVLPSIVDDRVDNMTDREMETYRAHFAGVRIERTSAACNGYGGPKRTKRDRRHPCRRVA